MQYTRDFTITARETEQFYRLLLLRRWRKGIWGFGLVGALVGQLYLTWLNLPLSGAWRGIAVVLVGLLTMLLVTLGMVLRTRRNVRTAIRKKGRACYVQHTEINGFGVTVTVEGEKARVGFEKLYRVEETRRAFYLYLTASEAWILPKEQMENAARECETLRTIFSTVIERRRRKLLEK